MKKTLTRAIPDRNVLNHFSIDNKGTFIRVARK